MNGWFIRNITPLLAAVGAIGIFIMYYLILFMPISLDQPKHDLAMYILGAMSGVLVTIYGYYFGSSAGSKAKQEALLKTSDDQKLTCPITDSTLGAPSTKDTP